MHLQNCNCHLRPLIWGVACLLSLGAGSLSAQQQNESVASTIASDAPRDPVAPAGMEAVWISSAGVRMNGVFYLAAGREPHPTVILFHGLPGNEQNLDLAQVLRRAGYNVLTFHYRGSWGSPGRFTLAGGVRDGNASVAYVEANASRFRVAARRLILIGHSYGGFVAARVAQSHPEVAATVLIAPWSPALSVPALSVGQRELPATAKRAFDDVDGRLGGTSALGLAREILAPGFDWHLESSSGELARKPLLIVLARHDTMDDQAAPLVRALAQRHAENVRTVWMDTDHPFSDHRIALETEVLGWLQKAPPGR